MLVMQAQFSRDGKLILTAGNEGDLIVQDLTGQMNLPEESYSSTDRTSPCCQRSRGSEERRR